MVRGILKPTGLRIVAALFSRPAPLFELRLPSTQFLLALIAGITLNMMVSISELFNYN
jgi:hypothetical protein